MMNSVIRSLNEMEGIVTNTIYTNRINVIIIIFIRFIKDI